MYHILETHPELVPFEGDINLRMERYKNKLYQLLQGKTSLKDFANAHKYYGFHQAEDGWVYREWAPAADQLYLAGEFNNWAWTETPMTRTDNGNWELFLPGDTLHKGSKVITIVKNGDHLTQPKQETMQRALELALEDAGISPDAIGYVNGHGTATKHGDRAETWATYNALKGRSAPISSLKSYIGHTLGACGGIEAWTSIHMMNRGWFSPNLNLKNVDPECAPLDYIVGDGREMDVEYVMSNNFAFGGINTSLIFKKV